MVTLWQSGASHPKLAVPFTLKRGSSHGATVAAASAVLGIAPAYSSAAAGARLYDAAGHELDTADKVWATSSGSDLYLAAANRPFMWPTIALGSTARLRSLRTTTCASPC